jgi:hypothetical protein
MCRLIAAKYKEVLRESAADAKCMMRGALTDGGTLTAGQATRRVKMRPTASHMRISVLSWIDG